MYKQGDYSLRLIKSTDAEWTLELHNDPEVLFVLTDTTFVSLPQQYSWIETIQTCSKSTRLVLQFGTVPVGLARLDDIDKINRSICVGLDIVTEHRGHGHGKAGFKLILDYCFKELNMHRVWLLVLDTNTRAYELYKKLGFVEEGSQRERIYRDGKYHNYIMMSILRNEYVSR